MDEQTKKLLNEYLVKLLGAIEKGADFAAEQIPLVIQEKLTFSLVMGLIWGAVGILFAIAGLVWYRIWRKRARLHGTTLAQRYGEPTPEQIAYRINEDGNNVAAIVGCVALVVSAIPVVLYNLNVIAKIYFAPRLYILEWLRGAL